MMYTLTRDTYSYTKLIRTRATFLYDTDGHVYTRNTLDTWMYIEVQHYVLSVIMINTNRQLSAVFSSCSDNRFFLSFSIILDHRITNFESFSGCRAFDRRLFVLDSTPLSRVAYRHANRLASIRFVHSFLAYFLQRKQRAILLQRRGESRRRTCTRASISSGSQTFKLRNGH